MDEPSSAPSTPVYERFATNIQGPTSPKRESTATQPRVHAMTVQDGTAEVTSTEAAPEHTVPFPTRAAEQATQTAHQHRYSDLTSTPELEDGPLFRAILSANVQRVKSLRSSLKSFLRAAEDAVDNMQDAAASQLAVDASLDALSAGSQSSDVLRGLWSGTLKAKRDQRRTHELKEIQQLQCVIVNIREAVDRLKSVDQRRKAFEADSKKHYDELGKYLARVEPDAAKSLSLDSKQAARNLAFEEHRTSYNAYVEGLLEAEEAAIALWLRSWAGTEEQQVPVSTTEEAQRLSRERRRATIARSLGERVRDSVVNADDVDGALESDGAASDEGESASATSGGSSGVGLQRKRSFARRRRSSIPNFAAFDHEGESAGDRFKGFLNKASQRISSATQQLSTATHEFSSRMPSSHHPAASQDLPRGSQGATLTAPDSSDSAARRKEGLLFATRNAVEHTSRTGDGGGSWSPHWCVLSEGYLAEFSDFRTLRVRNAPINLAFASVRVSKNTTRRHTLEVLTPTSRRLYQAPNEADMRDWISAISNSIESLLHGTSSVRHFDASRLSGTSHPLPDFGTSKLVKTVSNSTTPDPPAAPAQPAPPVSGFSHFSQRLPPWIGAPLSRRTSLGTKASTAKKLSERPEAGRRSSTSPSRAAHQPTQSESGSSSSPSTFTTAIIGSSPRLAESSAANGFAIPKSSSTGAISVSASREEAVSNSGRPTAMDDFDRGIEATVKALAGTALHPNEVKVINALRIKDIAARPDNRTCADCGAKDPRWASWNLGCTICIRCSGIHRSLGTHCSKVRSVDLDDWNTEQLASMERWGNAKVNALYEASKPADLVVSDSTIASFIKAKYVERKFVESNTQSPLASIAESPASIARR